MLRRRRKSQKKIPPVKAGPRYMVPKAEFNPRLSESELKKMTDSELMIIGNDMTTKKDIETALAFCLEERFKQLNFDPIGAAKQIMKTLWPLIDKYADKRTKDLMNSGCSLDYEDVRRGEAMF